jgi:phosphoheptose isomerase
VISPNREKLVRHMNLWNRESEKLFSRMYGDYYAGVCADVAVLMSDCLDHGGKIMTCGCGGSLSDHLNSELMNRFSVLRDQPIACIDLTSPNALITAIANDYSFDDVFSKQVIGLGKPGDIVIGLSTSANSESVIRALAAAHNLKMKAVLITGKGAPQYKLLDYTIVVPDSRTPLIQHGFLNIIHALCSMIDIILYDKDYFE